MYPVVTDESLTTFERRRADAEKLNGEKSIFGEKKANLWAVWYENDIGSLLAEVARLRAELAEARR